VFVPKMEDILNLDRGLCILGVSRPLGAIDQYVQLVLDIMFISSPTDLDQMRPIG
jgi:hypothetical protein